MMHKYMVVGITKAGKSTLLKKLIGVNVLISNERRATATKWVVNFHESKNFMLQIYRTALMQTKIETFEFQNLKTLQNAC
jgi:GTPase Era involved in 16S rRNA processing